MRGPRPIAGGLLAGERLRAASLLAAGSLVVHELRYVAGYGGGAGRALAEQGHSYMQWLEALARAARRRPSDPVHRQNQKSNQQGGRT